MSNQGIKDLGFTPLNIREEEKVLDFKNLYGDVSKPSPYADQTQLRLDNGADVSGATGTLDGDQITFQNIDASSIDNGETLGKVYYSAVVKEGDDAYYTDIQSAIDDGHNTIFIKNGYYTPSSDITFSQKVRLIGESRTGVIIDMDGADITIDINSYAYCTIENLSVQNSGAYGIINVDSSYFIMRNVKVAAVSSNVNQRTLTADGANFMKIEDCVIDYGGFRIENSADIQIRHTIISNSYSHGIYVDNTDNIWVESCIIESSAQEGLWLYRVNSDSDSYHKVTDSLIRNNGQRGLLLSYSSDSIITGNNFYNNDSDNSNYSEIDIGADRPVVNSNILNTTNADNCIKINGSNGVVTGNIAKGATSTNYDLDASTVSGNNQDL